MRLAVLGLQHETNTFSPIPTDDAAFAEAGMGGVCEGEQVKERFNDSTTVAGFLGAADSIGADIVPVAFATTNPGGIIPAPTFERITRRHLDLLAKSGPFDGILLSQHGSMVVEGFPDADAEYLRRVRAVVGPRVVIGNVMDTHGNVSPAQVAAADITLLWQTNPHVDCRARGLACATLAARAIGGSFTPVQAIVKLPMVAPILAQNTAVEPMAGLLQEARGLVAATPGLIDVSIAEGFPYSDVPHLGMAVVALADREQELADAAVSALARSIWQVRESFTIGAIPISDAVRLRPGKGGKPTVLLDVGDNIGGGSPGDSTFLLEELLRDGRGGYLINIVDRDAVLRCTQAGIGSHVELMVGGKADSLHGSPQRLSGTFRLLSDGRFHTNGPVHGGWGSFDSGPTAVIDGDDGGTVVLTSVPIPSASVDMYRAIGIDPLRYQLVVAKGVMSPQPSYGPISSRMVYVDTPGSTAADPATFRYRTLPHPIFPIDRPLPDSPDRT